MKGLPFVLLVFLACPALAHDVSNVDRELIAGSIGFQPALYGWLGAKHMITGYDHLLFLVGVIYYLRSIREVAALVTLFALGHSITLLAGSLLALNVNPYLIDAVIGLSVAYKGFDNLRGFDRLFGETPNTGIAVFVFGLFHGLGLATKLGELTSSENLVGNLIAFNVGVEIGQFLALVVILLLLRLFVWRDTAEVARAVINGSLVIAGFALMSYQVTRFLASQGIFGIG